VVAVIWLVIPAVVTVLVLCRLVWRCGTRTPDEDAYQARVKLHGIRTRQEVAQIKSEIRRGAAQARRELRAELHGLSNRERQP
jgi:hypothetical protein